MCLEVLSEQRNNTKWKRGKQIYVVNIPTCVVNITVCCQNK